MKYFNIPIKAVYIPFKAVYVFLLEPGLIRYLNKYALFEKTIVK